jgi:hypothetical protein
MHHSLKLILVGLPLFICGCVSTPPANTQTSYTYDLGDRVVSGLDEVVVSLLLKQHEGYHNLHVSIAIAANPIKSTSGSAYDVSSLTNRIESRISAQVSKALSELPSQNLGEVDAIRKLVVQEAERVVNSALINWKYAADYKIDVLVPNIYWTDSSVGKAPRSNRSIF